MFGSAGGASLQARCGTEKQKATQRVAFCGIFGRGKRIRTSGPCVPNAVLYQAELFPDTALDVLLLHNFKELSLAHKTADRLGKTAIIHELSRKRKIFDAFL